MSFEFPNHFLKLTAVENLTYFSRVYQSARYTPHELLALVGLDPDGELLVSQFSKGMKNRLSVARALLHDPRILFLDEPTSGLDPLNARGVKDLILAQKAQGKTIFLTTHDMTIADELCDLKLQHGRASVRVGYVNGGGQAQREFALAGLAHNADFLALLSNETVQTLHSQEASLEDVFIEVTGRRLQ